MTTKDLRTAYFPSYLSIDNIMACQTEIACQTRMRVPKFGFLVPDCNSEDLPVGTNVQLPLWAARVLCKPSRVYVSVSVPAAMKAVHREAIEENPSIIDLKKIHQHYFEAGHLCTSLYHNDAGELAQMLPEILQQRIMCIGEATIVKIDRNRWPQMARTSAKLSIKEDTMDILEEKLYRDSRNGSYGVDNWLDPLKRPISISVPPPEHQPHHENPVQHPTAPPRPADSYPNLNTPAPSYHDFGSMNMANASHSVSGLGHGYYHHHHPV